MSEKRKESSEVISKPENEPTPFNLHVEIFPQGFRKKLGQRRARISFNNNKRET